MKKHFYFFIFVFLILIGIASYALSMKINGHAVSDPLKNIVNYKSDLRQIHCYCGCDHTDLYNCYEEGMLTNCGVCMNEYKDYLSLKGDHSIGEISKIIDKKYEDTIPDEDD